MARSKAKGARAKQDKQTGKGARNKRVAFTTHEEDISLRVDDTETVAAATAVPPERLESPDSGDRDQDGMYAREDSADRVADGNDELQDPQSSDAEASEETQAPAADWQEKREKLQAKQKALSVLEAAKKRGVIYMSRVPPHLKPQKLRHILSEYGELGRLYMAPEDPSVRKRRKKLKGNSGKNFLEGWVEFADKKVAKRVAAMLNGNTMGGKRRSTFHYDIWCLKYLPKFKWDYLTEEIAYQKAVREQKLAAEVSAARKERDFYLSRVDRAKAADAHEERQKRKAATASEDAEDDEGAKQEGAGKKGAKPSARRIVRAYGQIRAKLDPTDDPEAPVMSHDVLALLAGRK